MLVQKLKAAVNYFNQDIPSDTPLLGKWTFNYGKEHWQNLADYPNDGALDFEDRQKYLLLLWKRRTFQLDTNSSIKGFSFDGEIVLVVRSSITDPTYLYKYEEHIEGLEQETKKLFDSFDSCDGWTVKQWAEDEVSNEFDTNLDGLKIRFTVEYEE